ncbi:MAG: hypothetical protein HY966_04340 [Ignavibacteriales bacterium]|nr:hypothetical protein [Ignavibacteriales bacterium]
MGQPISNRIHSLLSACALACLVAFVGCEKRNSQLVDSQGSAPTIGIPTVSPSSINTDTMKVNGAVGSDDVLSISLTASVRAAHRDGLSAIANVTYSLTDFRSATIFASGALVDDASHGDAKANDSLFSSTFGFGFPRQPETTLWLKVEAADRLGYASNQVLVPVRIGGKDQPPVLVSVSCPDTLRLNGTTQLLQLRATVSDPDGLTDVQKVFFNSFKPDGSPSSGNPFQMFDDGAAGGPSGDTVAGDGVFSLKVQLPSTTTPGAYRFEFQAVDRTGLKSSILSKTVVVVQ